MQGTADRRGGAIVTTRLDVLHRPGARLRLSVAPHAGSVGQLVSARISLGPRDARRGAGWWAYRATGGRRGRPICVGVRSSAGICSTDRHGAEPLRRRGQRSGGAGRGGRRSSALRSMDDGVRQRLGALRDTRVSGRPRHGYHLETANRVLLGGDVDRRSAPTTAADCWRAGSSGAPTGPRTNRETSVR